VYEPALHHRAYPAPHDPYGWPEPPRRRRLSRKGIAVLLALFAFLCLIGLAVLKLGIVVWNAPATPVVANSAARIGTIAADLAMKEAEVPEELREAVSEEADTLRRELIAPETGASARPARPAPAAAAH
jgi:hypothetical protein